MLPIFTRAFLRVIPIFLTVAMATLATLAGLSITWAQEETASVVAHVVNGTADGDDITGLAVTLQAFDGDEEIDRLEEETAEDGTVLFDDLSTEPELVYLLSAAYNDVRFFGDPFELVNLPNISLELTVYEMTEDSSVIRIIADNSVILGPDGDSGTLAVMQVTTFENASDRAFVGRDQSNTQLTVQVPLPIFAFDLESLDNPGSLVLAPNEDRKVFSILPILPGTEELILTYKVLYTTNDYVWSKSYPYPTNLVRLLVPEGVEISVGAGWTASAPTEVAGTVYDHYQTSDVGMQVPLTATIRNLPTSTGARSRDLESTLRYVAIGLGVLAVMGVGGYAGFWAIRRRNSQRDTLFPSSDHDPASSEREAALERLAWLDEEFEAGRLKKDVYESQRESQRGILRRLLEESAHE